MAPQGSPLWQGIWQAWVVVRSGIKKLLPTSKDETLRQPLYFNENILNEDGKIWGEVYPQLFRHWAKTGISRVRDLWDFDLNTYRSLDDIYHQVRPHYIEGLCTEIFQSIPMERGYYPSRGLVSLRLPESVQDPEFYHIQEVVEFGFLASIYRLVQGSERLFLASEEKTFIPRLHTTLARTMYMTIQGKVDSFNPKTPLEGALSLWIFRGGLIRDLDFDPKESLWKKKGNLQEEGFFGYTTKRGYKIISEKEAKQPKFDRHLAEMGYT